MKIENKLTWIVANDLIYCHFDKALLAYSRVDGMDLAGIKVSLPSIFARLYGYVVPSAKQHQHHSSGQWCA